MLYSLLAAAARTQPDKATLVENDRCWSYGQLLEAADNMASQLSQLGLKPAETAALRIANSTDFAISLFGIARCGAAPLLLDPVLKEDEAVRYAQRAQVKLIVCRDPATAEAAVAAGLHAVKTPAEAHAGQPPSELPPAAVLSADDIAVMLMSSGTAGPAKIVPKTAVQAQAAVDIFLRTVPYGEGDRILAALPFNHSFGFFNVLLAGIAAQATLFVEKYSPRQTAQAVAAHRITILPATPFMLRMMAATDFPQPPDFSSVRVALSAGAALPAAVLNSMRDKFGIHVWQSYGTTESGPVTLARDQVAADTPSGSVGLAYRGVTVSIRDVEGADQPPGCEGEVAVNSPAAASGYLYEPPDAATCFRDGWVLTGDVGFVHERSGELVICGRRKRMINVAGKKVAPDEVEACLLSHPAVTDVLVAAESLPTGEERVAAYVVAKQAVDLNALRDHCAQNLADFKVPRRIELVSELKRGSMGKVFLQQQP
jgi:long-chain acyl-CoA synthetase